MDFKSNELKYNEYIKTIKEEGMVDNSRELPYWGNIPIKSFYLNPLYEIYKPGYKFLDLGCGVGNVLLFAKNIGYDVFGVEFNYKYLNHLKGYKHLHYDITKLDGNFYNDFDVIYSYKPLKENFNNFLEDVISNMKENSFLLTPQHKVISNNVIDLSCNLYKIKKEG